MTKNNTAGAEVIGAGAGSHGPGMVGRVILRRKRDDNPGQHAVWINKS
jgi:hypothetical protein